MIIEKYGNITDKILLLGRKESCIYLLKGDGEYAILGGGMVHIVPEIIEQLREFRIEEEKIKHIFILHSHFDHCGIVPFFKKRWHWATISASEKSKSLLSLPKVIEAIETMNHSILEKYGRKAKGKILGIDTFTGIDVENVIKGGDRLSCGGIAMEVIDVPGHSSCSVAIYMPEEKAMFASDAGGIPLGNQVFTSANSNFDKYQESLEKMAEYEIDIYLAEHYGVRTGEDARNFLTTSMRSAKETRKILEESLLHTRDLKKSTLEITDLLMEKTPDDFLPREVIEIVAGQMLRYLAKKLEI